MAIRGNARQIIKTRRWGDKENGRQREKGSWEDGKRGKKLRMTNVNHNPITQITQME